MDDKGFISERGFGKLISPFAKIIENKAVNSSVRTRCLVSLLWQGISMQIW